MIYLTGAVAICLFLIGRWGSHQAAELVPRALDPEAREKKERVMRRGSWVIQIVGVLLFSFSVAGIVYLVVRR